MHCISSKKVVITGDLSSAILCKITFQTCAEIVSTSYQIIWRLKQNSFVTIRLKGHVFLTSSPLFFALYWKMHWLSWKQSLKQWTLKMEIWLYQRIDWEISWYQPFHWTENRRQSKNSSATHFLLVLWTQHYWKMNHPLHQCSPTAEMHTK